MKKNFSFYEFVGFIAPGSILLLILVQLFPDTLKTFGGKELSLGGLGIFVIIAYVIGHLIQSVGNVMEKIWWRFFGGMPTNWVIQDKRCMYLSEEQLKAIPEKIVNILGIETKASLKEYDPKQWVAITRQIYAAVKQADAAERVDIFNGNYGFFRGIASALAVGLFALILKTGVSHLEFSLIIVAFFVMAISRMHRFAKHYALELFVQFLQTEKLSTTKVKNHATDLEEIK